MWWFKNFLVHFAGFRGRSHAPNVSIFGKFVQIKGRGPRQQSVHDRHVDKPRGLSTCLRCGFPAASRWSWVSGWPQPARLTFAAFVFPTLGSSRHLQLLIRHEHSWLAESLHITTFTNCPPPSFPVTFSVEGRAPCSWNHPRLGKKRKGSRCWCSDSIGEDSPV